MVILTVTLIMSISAAYQYVTTKNKIIDKIKLDSNLSILALNKNTSELMASYSIHEYEQLMLTEMEKSQAMAIVVENYSMGLVVGKASYISGKIRDTDDVITEYDETNSEQIDRLDSSYYSEQQFITNSSGEQLGRISIYTSDTFLQAELEKIINGAIINSIAVSLLLIMVLFFTFRQLVQKPIASITKTIRDSDADGIPIDRVPENGPKELAILAHSMNKMIDSIRSSRFQLKEQHDQLELFERVFNHTHDGIVITDANERIIKVNPAFAVITGYLNEEVLGKTPRILSSKKQAAVFYKDMWTALSERAYWQGELWNRKKNGDLYAQQLSISVLLGEDNEVVNYIGVIADITKSKQQQEELNFMAHYDVLTGLPNRALFVDRFHQAIAHSRRTGRQLAICFLDLDKFKPVNDNYGHEVGDQLLIEVAERIKSCIREEDTVSRQGGDEFAAFEKKIPYQGRGGMSLPYCLMILNRYQPVKKP